MNELSLQKNTENYGVEANSDHVFQRNEKDTKSEYFSERVKKLTTAVYIVTNHIPQHDPLRTTIRKFSIKLMSVMGQHQIGYSPQEFSNETIGLCKKIVEMLEVAFFAGYVSEMNFSVLKTEFDLFINEISGFDGAQKMISQNSLKVVSFPDNEMSFKESHSEAKNLKGQSGNFTLDSKPTAASFKSSVASKLPLKNQPKNHQSVTQKSVIDTKKISRKEAIISIIKMKGEVSIKDISSVVINCSEKTIQRELTAMISEGVLRKSGDRRWSVYSLAK